MADEQIVALLQEIRDLQKQHIQKYQEAVSNQKESIEIQRKAIHRQRTSLVLLFVVLAGFLVFVLAAMRH